MAHLTDFFPDHLHDVFLSYSHGDLKGQGRGLWKQWSEQFYARLEAELEVSLRTAAHVFFDAGDRPDHRVDPNQPLGAQLRGAVEGSSLFAMLMTSHFLRSDYCKLERSAWIARHGAALSSLAGRFIVVRAEPTEEAAWPDELRDGQGKPAVGHWMYDRGPVDSESRPYGWTTPDDPKFKDAIVGIAGAMTRRLRAMRQECERRRSEAVELRRFADPADCPLYLHARRANVARWDEAHNRLSDHGYPVQPEEPEPDRSELDDDARIRWERERLEYMAESRAVVLLPGDDAKSYSLDLLEVAKRGRDALKQRTGRRLPCAIANSIGPAFKSSPRVANARNLGVAWLDVDLPRIPAVVDTWLAREAEGGAPKAAPAARES